MTQIEFLNKNIFFTTRQYSFALGIRLETASRQLHRLKDTASLVLLTRGIWAQIHHPLYIPSAAVPLLLGKEQGYVSFLTALHRYDVISQIPSVIQIATTGHGRKIKTPLGSFEFFHLQPSMMQTGIKVASGTSPYNIATAEKALVDTFYLSTRKGRRFSKFPELDLSQIKKTELKKLIQGLSPSIQKLVVPKINDLF